MKNESIPSSIDVIMNFKKAVDDASKMGWNDLMIEVLVQAIFKKRNQDN